MSDLSEGEQHLAFQLNATGVSFEREYRFYPPRMFRFDFVILPLSRFLAVEVEGGAFTGGHKRGKDYETDCEKNNLAVMEGWSVLRVTPQMCEDGRALSVIERAMG